MARRRVIDKATTLRGSYVLRVIECRRVRVDVTFELHDLARGTRERFASFAALRRRVEQHAREDPQAR